ncbi:MAG: RluA family pseudouridine synthase [Candidatus Zixiibacteriota bacterium]|nr:MAG: RluA family pseudouridine synthase [candidate division Zixibacteria bacterium]
MTDPATEPTRVEVEAEHGTQPQRIDSYLGKHPRLKITRTRAQKLIEQGLVLLNGQPVSKKATVHAGDTIALTIPPAESTALTGENIPLDIVFEDDHMAVINKPPGMVTHPGPGNYSGTLVNALIFHFHKLSRGSGADRPGIVHRLDKDTSGLLVVARDDETYQKLQKAIQKRQLRRTYLALVCGHMKEEKGRIELPVGRSLKDRKRMTVTEVGSRPGVTDYRLVRRYRSYDLLEVSLQTGRTHQIRVHLSHLGHPVFGDPEYGGREKWHRGIFAPERPLAKRLLDLMKRQALHATRLEFAHPFSGENVSLEAGLPGDFQKVLDMLDREGG